MTAPALRALFVTQGAMGTTVLGHAMSAAMIRRGLERHPEVQARFAGVGPRGRAAELAIRHLPVLSARDLDLYGLRFHLSESARGTQTALRELREAPADVVSLSSHALGLLSGPLRRRAAVVLSVDATIWDWGAMGHFRPATAKRRVTLAGDLALERRAFHRADLVVCWSEWARQGVLRRAPRARAQVIHPGLDVERFHPGPGRPEGGPLRLLFVGGRLEAKGGLDLIEAARPMLESGAAELDVVTGDEVPAVRGVRAHRLPPADPRLVELYQHADILCLPTWGDAVPFVVVEALACGTPVIGSTVGSIPDLIDHERAGILVPPRDVAALRAAIEALAADPARRRALGARGVEHVAANYDLRRQTDRLVAALHDAVAHRRSGG